MFGPITIGAVVGVAVILQVYFVARIIRQSHRLVEKDACIAKLRSDLACADASLFRLTDRIAEMQPEAPRASVDAVVPLFPEAAATAAKA